MTEQITLTDKQFNDFLKAVDNPPKANKALKDLLREIKKNKPRSQLLIELIEKCEKIKLKQPFSDHTGKDMHDTGYNQALEDVIQLLKTKLGE